MKYSIRHQISEIFIILLIGTIGLCWIMNLLFLEQYYTMDKSKSLMVIYNSLNLYAQEIIEDESVELKITKMCEDNNIDLLVMDSDLSIKYASMNDPKIMQDVLFSYIFDENETDNTIQTLKDNRNDSEYFVMWGYLESGDFYVMRTAIQSILDSVAISNRFLLYAGAVIILIGSVIISMISRKITEPLLELTKISDRMIHLDFNAKYTSGGMNEIGLLGERMNILSETLEGAISELKTANNELQRDIKKKEEIDEMRQDFISNVSHELKTPISLIQGYAEGLLECVHDDEESRNFYCEVIMDEAAKMNKMVKSLLTLTQLEFGGDNIMLERVNLSSMISNILSSTSILAGDKEVQINNLVEESVFVWADEFKLEEVVTNYISNAFYHVSGSNIVEVSATEMTDEKNPNRTLVHVMVYNSGEPIPEEDIDKVWIKFYKVDKARSREYGGSGIGLSIVKAIMDAHNQQCGVENCREGVCFWFNIEKCTALTDF